MEQGYFYQYFFIGIFVLFSVLFGAGILLVARWVAPRKPSPVKNATYECGLESEGDAWIQFRIPYYIYALIFVIFDVEIIFLYPWAVSFKKLGMGAFAAAMIFIGVLLIGLIYEWGKNNLEWE